MIEEVPEPEPWARGAAIDQRDEAVALQLLRRRQLPVLNDVLPYHETLHHSAISKHLPEVAVTSVAHPYFSESNAENRWGQSALHLAADGGLPLRLPGHRRPSGVQEDVCR